MHSIRSVDATKFVVVSLFTKNLHCQSFIIITVRRHLSLTIITFKVTHMIGLY